LQQKVGPVYLPSATPVYDLQTQQNNLLKYDLLERHLHNAMNNFQARLLACHRVTAPIKKTPADQ
jgi:hypothetical protein